MIRNANVSLIVAWRQPYINSTVGCSLTVTEYATRMPFPTERVLYIGNQPTALAETTYMPELSRAREYGWKEEYEEQTFISSINLADMCVRRFIDLALRFQRGEIEPFSMFG